MKDLVTKIKVVEFASADVLNKEGGESLSVIGPAKATTTYTFLEGDAASGSGATAVGADFLIVGDSDGVKAANVVTYSEAGSLASIGYVGDKQYLTVTVANPETAPMYFAISGDLHNSPGTY